MDSLIPNPHITNQHWRDFQKDHKCDYETCTIFTESYCVSSPYL